MKAALTPPALQQRAEIDIGLFTGRAASGQRDSFGHRSAVRYYDLVGHVHTLRRVYVHDGTMRSSVGRGEASRP
jgi:hypothetical protein